MEACYDISEYCDDFSVPAGSRHNFCSVLPVPICKYDSDPAVSRRKIVLSLLAHIVIFYLEYPFKPSKRYIFLDIFFQTNVKINNVFDMFF